MKTIYDYSDYKDYLKAQIEKRGRGEKSRVAEALKCNIAYVSQILNAHAQLSLEQAEALNDHFSHNEEESDFFLLLVMLGRSGSAALQKRLEKKLKATQHARNRVENRIKNQKTLPEESQSTFYSAWYYTAIHVLLSIPHLQTKDKIARHLGLSVEKVNQALDFLVSGGLALREGEKFKIGQVGLHLTNDSPWLPRHHTSWRLQCVSAIEKQRPEDFHYTSVASFSPRDLPEVRKIFVDAIEKVRAVVRKSPEEQLICYTLDFFRIEAD